MARGSVVFVESNPSDVIPRGRLMAEETLADLRVRLARDAHRNHFEMHHVVARWRLMAFGAGLRHGRRVAEFRDRPLRGGVTLGAVVAEQSQMPVFGLMAGRAVELRFFPLELRRGRGRSAAFAADEPGHEVGASFFLGDRRVMHLSQADLRESDVIHLCRTRNPTLMFEMARVAGSDVGVKRARLALENGEVIRVTDDAALRLDPLHRRVTGGAVVSEESVRLRQLPGTDRVSRHDLHAREMQQGKRRRRDRDDNEGKREDELAHESHLSPK